MAIIEHLEAFAIKKALGYMDKEPEANIPKLLGWFDKLDAKNMHLRERTAIRQVISDKDSNWYKLIMSLWQDIDPGVRNRLFENFVVNAGFLGYQRQVDNKQKYNCNIPWAILMDPTSACNLNCTGCWAAEYGNHMNLTFEEMDSIVKQGVELGTYMYLFTGGEPMVRRKDILKLCESHPDCIFSTFTNGTLIDEAFADEMLRVKNFIPAISVEGFEEATDSRRGEGTYQKIIKAMNILKSKRLPFGISCCYTSANAEVIGSEEYFDQMIALGAKFAWFFTYMPVGKGAVKELMATAEQREMMYHKIREYRSSKPIFTVDFWNDGEYVGGCIAGGRSYLHINANGDIEPCAFIHYSDSNIREKTLLEAYRSPLFMGYHDNQPWNKNHLRPCPVLDNPGRLTQLVEKIGAKSTDYQNLESAEEFSSKCVETAEKWAPVAERLWKESRTKKEEEQLVSPCVGCGHCAEREEKAI
jgi:MoaA/NifB/PqqE/SkfB family radical SAM enzyme